MGGYISQNVIDRILAEADIVQVISDYVPLNKSGKNYRALCPFHEERTPSFTVSPGKQVFHCFGCGTGGNVFTFVMKMENVAFPQSVRILGEKFGIPVPSQGEKPGRFDDLYRINEKIADFFHRQLKRNKRASSYLHRRGFKPSIIDQFRLGWAPSSRMFLNFARKENLPEDKLEKIGLLVRSSRDGSFYPYFRGRIMFPIFSPFEKILGFGGRTLDDSQPKYLNSPQSPIFDKGKVLYGLNLAREHMRRSGEVILVEGYTDVIAVYQEGIHNVVASLGTSLTRAQVRLLKRYSSTVFLTYDEDSAGEAATLRGLDLLLEDDLQVRITSLPSHDPAELIQRKGKEEFLKIKEKALPYIDYRIHLALKEGDSLTMEKKLKLLNSLFLTLEKINSPNLVDDALRKIAHRLDLNEESLRSEFSRFLKENTRGKFSFSSTLRFEVPEKEEIEKQLLQVMLCGREVVEKVKTDFSTEDFTNPLYRRLAQEMFVSDNVSPHYLINHFDDENLSSLVSSLTLNDYSLQGVNPCQIAEDIIHTLRRRSHQRQIEQLCRMIAESEKRGEEARVRKLCEQLVQLRKRILIR